MSEKLYPSTFSHQSLIQLHCRHEWTKHSTPIEVTPKTGFQVPITIPAITPASKSSSDSIRIPSSVRYYLRSSLEILLFFSMLWFSNSLFTVSCLALASATILSTKSFCPLGIMKYSPPSLYPPCASITSCMSSSNS